MVELRGINKYFPSNGVMALKNAGFTLRPGEIHALLGENGTGKSTLMHILAGYFSPSSGSILIDGKSLRFSAPADALTLGIGMVRQHPGFIQGFKVWEDCILGAEKQNPSSGPNVVTRKCRKLFLDPGMSRKRVGELSNQWNFDLPLDSKAESLTVSQRQKAAVLSLLLRDVKWLIFDEPTAVLTPGETQSLIELLNRLRGEGRGVIFITHKLEEALAVSDRVTVIHQGVTGEPRNTKELSIEELKDSIFGDRHLFQPSQEIQNGHYFKPLLVIKDLQLSTPELPPIKNVNLELKGGRIMGIAGVRDGGLETLELAVTGFLRTRTGVQGRSSPLHCSGSVTLNGHDITGKGVEAFRNAGGAYLGADRLRSNLAPALPIMESLIIHAYRRARRGIFLDMNYLNSWQRKIMNRAGIAQSISDKASSFSGGMLQRVLLAREFAEDASLIVLAEPGSALDEFNRSWLMEELKAHRRRGAAALIFSTDLGELISIADEVLMLKNGMLTAVDKESSPEGQ